MTHFLKASLFATFILALGACGSSGAAPAAAAPDGAAHAAESACALIDAQCDPLENQGGLAKECHELAETQPEEDCQKRKEECLKACAPVK